MEEIKGFREKPEKLNSYFTPYYELLVSTVNIGLSILSFDVNIKHKNWRHLAPPALLLRNFTELVDAISILIRNSNTQGATHILRNLVEASFVLRYLLHDNTEQKCEVFAVADIYNQIKHLNKLLELNITHTNADDKTYDIKELIKAQEKLISSKEDQDIIQELERVKKGNVINWYRTYEGPSNIRAVAKAINQEEEYNRTYAYLSIATHSNDVIAGNVISVNGQTLIKQIRQHSETPTTTFSAVSVAMTLFSVYVEKRVPQIKDDYNKWHYDTKKKLDEIQKVIDSKP